MSRLRNTAVRLLNRVTSSGKKVVVSALLNCLVSVYVSFHLMYCRDCYHEGDALFVSSNVPSKLFYASVSSEILHIAGTTAGLMNMAERVNLLLIWMKRQGCDWLVLFSY